MKDSSSKDWGGDGREEKKQHLNLQGNAGRINSWVGEAWEREEIKDNAKVLGLNSKNTELAFAEMEKAVKWESTEQVWRGKKDFSLQHTGTEVSVGHSHVNVEQTGG